MTLFHLLALAATLFFAYKFFEKINNLEDKDVYPPDGEEKSPVRNLKAAIIHKDKAERFSGLVEKADECFEEGDILEAQKYLEDALIIKDDAEVLNKLGFVYAQQEKFEEAEEAYTRAIALNPRDDSSHSAFASMLAKLERFEEAIEHYKKALIIDANYEVTYYNYANLLQKLDRFEEALHHYKIALRINPDFAEAQEEVVKLENRV